MVMAVKKEYVESNLCNVYCTVENHHLMVGGQHWHCRTRQIRRTAQGRNLAVKGTGKYNIRVKFLFRSLSGPFLILLGAQGIVEACPRDGVQDMSAVMAKSSTLCSRSRREWQNPSTLSYSIFAKLSKNEN